MISNKIALPCTVDLQHGELERHQTESKTYRARSGSASIKTTIPAWVAHCLDIEAKQILVWKIIFNKDKPNAALVYLKMENK
jgi:hypothetical protein